MQKPLLTFLLLIFSNLQTFSQVDSAKIAQDTVAVKGPTKVNFKSLAIPAAFISYGLISLTGDNAIRRLDFTTNAELREDHPDFAFKVDNYTRYVPAVAVYALDFLGVKAKNNMADRTIMLATSLVVASASVGALKIIVGRTRPNSLNNVSFPSGHTALAFMTAEFLNQEYKDHSVWYSISGYAMATGTGILRLYNNAHWVSDVVAGAGFGILSTKVTYLVYPYIRKKLFHNKPVNMMISPDYQNGNMGFSLIKRF
ncbi:MAG: phosphatase PAP2 family protein [Bacteroidota bacterium]